MRTVYGRDFYKDSKAMRQVAFASKLDWSYRPPDGSTEEDCGEKHSYDDILQNEVNRLARCIYLTNGPIKHRPLPVGIHMIRQSCSQPTEARLPTCFYHLIKTLREYPNAPELASVTAELSEALDFNVPPELSYLLLNAVRTAYGDDFYMSDKAMRQVAFISKLDWSYRPPEGSTEEDCYKYSFEHITTNKLGDLARCVYLRNRRFERSAFPLLKDMWTIKQTCSQLTEAKLPVCFYHIIKTLRKYPDAPELKSVTTEVKITAREQGFRFRKTPPALAYVLLDAMRSTYGKYSEHTSRWDQIGLWSELLDSYEGDETPPTNCEQVTDEDIIESIEKLEWVAACRFKERGIAVE